MTTSVGIIYFSGTGKTAAMAEAIIAGAQSVADTEVHDLRITGEMIEQGRWNNAEFINTLASCEVIIFGTPTYMGGPAAQFKTFADALGEQWYTRSWADKIAGGFTTSGGLSGDKQGTLMYLNTLAMQLGMIWVGQNSIPGQMSGVADEDAVNRISSYIGVMGQGRTMPEVPLPAGDLETAKAYAKRVVTMGKNVLIDSIRGTGSSNGTRMFTLRVPFNEAR